MVSIDYMLSQSLETFKGGRSSHRSEFTENTHVPGLTDSAGADQRFLRFFCLRLSATSNTHRRSSRTLLAGFMLPGPSGAPPEPLQSPSSSPGSLQSRSLAVALAARAGRPAAGTIFLQRPGGDPV